jgi:hypothetical protein
MIKGMKMADNRHYGYVIALIGKDGLPMSDTLSGSDRSDEILEVMISVGSDDGVGLDTRFVIYQEGDELFNPINNESLGYFEIVKGRGRVTHVQEKMSKIRSTETTKVLRSSIETAALGILRQAPEPSTYKTVAVPFRRVKVGDIIKPI